jgi:hypothetical protein
VCAAYAHRQSGHDDWLHQQGRSAAHGVSLTGLFRSAALDTNGSFAFRCDKAGACSYIGTIGARVTGSIVVQQP